MKSARAKPAYLCIAFKVMVCLYYRSAFVFLFSAFFFLVHSLVSNLDLVNC